MAKSIRISDRLYDSALADAALLHRSLAQQVEHWAEVGRALEAAGLDVGTLKALVSLNNGVSTQEDEWLDRFKRAYQEATKGAVRAGRLSQDSLRLVSRSNAAKAKVTYPTIDDFDD